MSWGDKLSRWGFVSRRTRIPLYLTLFVLVSLNLLFVTHALSDEMININEGDFAVRIAECHLFLKPDVGCDKGTVGIIWGLWHMPVYFVLLKVVMMVLGMSLPSLHLISLLSSCAVIVLMFLTIRKFCGDGIASLGTLIYLFSFVNFQYSREFEENMLFAALVLACVYVFLSLISGIDCKSVIKDSRAWLFLLLLLAAGFTHQFFVVLFVIFLTAILSLLFFFRGHARVRHNLLHLLFGSFVVGIVPFICNLLFGVKYSSGASSVLDIRMAPSIDVWHHILRVLEYLVPSKYGAFIILDTVVWGIALFMLLVFAGLLYGLAHLFAAPHSPSRRLDATRIAHVLVPFFALSSLVGVSLFPASQYKFHPLVFVFVLLYLALAFGLSALWKLSRKRGLRSKVFVVAVLALMAISILWGFHMTWGQPEDYEFFASPDAFFSGVSESLGLSPDEYLFLSNNAAGMDYSLYGYRAHGSLMRWSNDERYAMYEQYLSLSGEDISSYPYVGLILWHDPINEDLSAYLDAHYSLAYMYEGGAYTGYLYTDLTRGQNAAS